MDLDKLYEIIDYALERERDAVKFYKNLRDENIYKSSKELLNELIEMELDHINILLNFREKDIEKYRSTITLDAKFDKILKVINKEEELTPQDVLITAMQKEEESKQLYFELAQMTDDEFTKKVFMRLSDEEAKHKLKIQDIYEDQILTEN